MTSPFVKVGVMTVPIVKDKIQVYSGDFWSLKFEFFVEENTPRDLSVFEQIKAQWRVKENNPVGVINLNIIRDEDNIGIIYIEATPEQTFSMKSSGVIDIKADNQTLIKFETDYVRNVTH